jgi:hypothetical protein
VGQQQVSGNLLLDWRFIIISKQVPSAAAQ